MNLEIKESSFTAIIGSNGSGKTTLAKHFNALLTPLKGSLLVDGTDTKNNEFNARKKVGFVFQNFEDQLIYSIVEEDLAFGLENLGLNNYEINNAICGILDKLKSRHLAKNNINALSAGQKQLVALGGVLVMKPKYIVFDEPTTNLDARNRKNIMSIITELNKKEKIGIILITNMLDDIKYADQVVVMKNGVVAFNDKKSKLTRKMLKRWFYD